MKIKYIAWKQVVRSDMNRLIYGTKGKGLHNQRDQAIQAFNTPNQNPGLWAGFTGGERIPRKSDAEAQNQAANATYDIPLANSVNPLRLWQGDSPARINPIKISHQIWDRNENHAQVIIEPWYLGYMRILSAFLEKVKLKFPDNPNVDILQSFVNARLALTTEIRANILQWIYDTRMDSARWRWTPPS